MRDNRNEEKKDRNKWIAKLSKDWTEMGFKGERKEIRGNKYIQPMQLNNREKCRTRVESTNG